MQYIVDFKYLRYALVVFTIFQGLAFDGYSQQITTKTLLKEMINREAISRFPAPAYKCAQFSSYDRNSVALDQPGWFANWDRSQWIRIENNKGRREFVMMDTNGPGAVVRFWVTVADYGGNGILRVYLDNSEEPEIEGNLFQLLSEDKLVGYPLASSVSEYTNYWQRGHNLYFPIAYAEHCKITYESAAVNEQPGAISGEALYYNINYRTYDVGTEVKTFTLSDIQENKSIIDEVNQALIDPDRDVAQGEMVEMTGDLTPNDKLVKQLSGEKAIHSIKMKLKADNYEQALRSTVLEISFDTEQTVWCPVGDFFGTGYKLSPFSTYYTSAKSDGLLEAKWIMPFENSCEIKLVNYGEQEVTIEKCEIETTAYEWGENSMHFGAGWFEQYKLYTGGGGRPMDGSSGEMFDVNYVTLEGKGVLVGTGVTLFNTVDSWWGEGDEKVYVDNETFPSHIGTGTEDYYGYAWCHPNKFSHPYIAQPDGSGNLTSGYTVNSRYRGLDAIPFTQKLQFDMEMWHWASCIINHAPVTYWYMIPGGKSNRRPVPEQIKNSVVLDISDFYSRTPDENGRVEAEYLKVNASGGNIQIQSVSQFNWSNGSQIWWTDGIPGNKATLKFKIEKEAEYEVKVSLTKAIDYGIFSLKIDGKPGLLSYDAYHPGGVVNSEVSLGIHNLGIGEHTLEITITGANPNAVKGYMFGADYLDFNELATSAKNLKNAEETIKVYPNPFTESLTVSGLTKLSHQMISIYNSNGIKVLSKIIENNVSSTSVDAHLLSPGVYMLKIGELYSCKIIKCDV